MLKWSWAVMGCTGTRNRHLTTGCIDVKPLPPFNRAQQTSIRLQRSRDLCLTSVAHLVFTFKQKSEIVLWMDEDGEMVLSAHSGCRFGMHAYWSSFFNLFLSPNIFLRRLTWPFLFTGDLFSAEVRLSLLIKTCNAVKIKNSLTLEHSRWG